MPTSRTRLDEHLKRRWRACRQGIIKRHEHGKDKSPSKPVEPLGFLGVRQSLLGQRWALRRTGECICHLLTASGEPLGEEQTGKRPEQGAGAADSRTHGSPS